ncbi:MAG: biotin--[acetyl-CoA-carboxylase] ligase [Alteraurantiacibacter sp.]
MLEFVTETGSTNADLLARLKAGEPFAEGHWFIADRQSAGRGRQGRSWLDAPGNFMGSTVVKLGPHDPPPASLSLVLSLSVYDVLARALDGLTPLSLKWPNDVMLSGAKVAGLLLEREGEHVVAGVGVNLAQAPHIEGRKTAALVAVERDVFARDLAAAFATDLARWRQYGTGPILARWRKAAHPPGTRITVHTGEGGPLAGTFEALGEDGSLRLRLPDGSVRAIHAGDVMLED